LFPVLDADLKLAPDGAGSTVLTLAGSYRPPLGTLGEALDRAVLRRVAAATIRSFVARVAAQITGHPVPNASALPPSPPSPPSPPEVNA